MDPEQFRTEAHRLVDWMADYLRDVGHRRVVPDVRPGDVAAALPAHAPESPEPFERLTADFERIVLPAMTHWNHPRWFAYFPANHSPPSILAEMAVAAMGAQCMSWQTSPAATELEQVTMAWLRELLGLPEAFTGVIHDTASTATLVAMLSARERATGHRAGEEGLAAFGRTLTAYASRERHSSIDKAVKLSGIGLANLRLIDTDAAFAMRVDALDEALARDRDAGHVPACVVATVGTTSSTAIDPLPAIAEVCARHGVWLHVDAAYAGSAAIVPELRWVLDGAAGADSLVTNPHKWLGVNFDCTAYFVRDVPALLRAFAVTPEYLRTAHDAQVVNYRDWGIQLGRRFRALKLWWTIRAYGAEGLREPIRRHVALGHELAGWVDADDRFERMAPAPLGLVCFRLRCRDGATDSDMDDRTRDLLARVNATGQAFLTHTTLGGRLAVRFAIGQRTTTRADVAATWAAVHAAVGAPAEPA